MQEMLGRATKTRPPEDQLEVANRTEALMRGCRRRVRRRHHRHVMGVAGGDVGTGHPMEGAILAGTAPTAEAVAEAKVAHLVEEDPQVAVEAEEAPQGVDREGTRAAPDRQRSLVIPPLALLRTMGEVQRQ